MSAVTNRSLGQPGIVAPGANHHRQRQVGDRHSAREGGQPGRAHRGLAGTTTGVEYL